MLKVFNVLASVGVWMDIGGEVEKVAGTESCELFNYASLTLQSSICRGITAKTYHRHSGRVDFRTRCVNPFTWVCECVCLALGSYVVIHVKSAKKYTLVKLNQDLIESLNGCCLA